MKPSGKNVPRPFSEQIAEKENRKLKALRQTKRSAWTGLGFFGLVGWSVAVPVLIGIALGTWLDKRFATSFSWTLSLLIAGLLLGCMVAWNGISKDNNNMPQPPIK